MSLLLRYLLCGQAHRGMWISVPSSLRFYSSLRRNPSIPHHCLQGNITPRFNAPKRNITRAEHLRLLKQRNKTIFIYVTSLGVLFVGLTYAAVPLYRLYCQATGYGGQPVIGHDIDKVEHMTPVLDRLITVRFNADVSSSLQWNFKPQQTELKVAPGETALAFYRATNPTDVPIIGISTYNILPFEAGPYFNKIQCFCFEEQRLNPHEEVDMPVFFYIDPDFAEDPRMEEVSEITLSYTFFEAKDDLVLPLPNT